MFYNLGPFRPRFGELGRKARPFYFKEFGIKSHYLQRAGEKLLKMFRQLGSTGGGGGGGQSSEYLGRGGRGKLFAGCKLIRAPVPNQYQIITLLILKTEHIAKIRIALKSILLEIPFK